MSQRLLVIDDDEAITKIVVRIAESLDYTVRCVTDPDAAVDAFDEFAPDVVLVDIVMPGRDGIDVLRAILARRSGVRVITMSGFGPGFLKLAKAVATFEQQPDIADLAKPFRREDVIAALRRDDQDRGGVGVGPVPAAA